MHFSCQSLYSNFYGILQILEPRVMKMKWPKRCKTCLTKPTMAQHQRRQPQPRPTIIWHQRRLPDSRPQAVQQLAILGVVLETTARLTQAATVMWSATTSTTAVMISQQLAVTVSVLYILCVPQVTSDRWEYFQMLFDKAFIRRICLWNWLLIILLWRKSWDFYVHLSELCLNLCFCFSTAPQRRELYFTQWNTTAQWTLCEP